MATEQEANDRIPVPNGQVTERVQAINAEEQFYSIGLFDILGFSNFVERNGYQIILDLYSKLVALLHAQASTPEGGVSPAGSVAPVPTSRDWKYNSLIANANGYVQVGHFSDTFILFVNYNLFAPSFYLRDTLLEPHPLHANIPGSSVFGPFFDAHHVYLSFLQTCMHFFCQSILDGIPLRGVISSGLARMDPAQSIFFGAPLVEAGKGEPAQDAIGIGFGKSFLQYHPIYNSYFIPYSKHIKTEAPNRQYLCHAALDWPRYWRQQFPNKRIEEEIGKMNLEPRFSKYYDNALRFFRFSSENADWSGSVNCEGTDDIKEFFRRADQWLSEKE